jgi:outer membrane protein OmpA-like peptidoglycan-associated protein
MTQALDALDIEGKHNNLATLERWQARQAIDRVPSVRARDRADAMEEAQVLLKTAEYSLRISQAKDQLVQLDREHDAILVEASKRDALAARKEAERMRLKALALEEEQALALTEAELPVAAVPQSASDIQTKRVAEAKAKEAELTRLEEELSAQMAVSAEDVLNSRGNSGYLLSGTAFDPGASTLTPAAKDVLRQLAKKLKLSGKAWSIEGHMDALGEETGNVLLSKKRADAVLSLLKAAGVPSGKLSAKGLGSAKAMASNQSKSGRAQNRRVEILQK